MESRKTSKSSKIEAFRSWFEEAETRKTCIAYRTHQVPKITPPVVSYQMPHKFHRFPKTTSETKISYSFTPQGVWEDLQRNKSGKKLER